MVIHRFYGGLRLKGERLRLNFIKCRVAAFIDYALSINIHRVRVNNIGCTPILALSEVRLIEKNELKVPLILNRGQRIPSAPEFDITISKYEIFYTCQAPHV